MMAHAFPHSLLQKEAEVAVNRLPGREEGRRRQVAPLAAGADHIKQPVQQTAHVGAARSPAGFRWRDQGSQQRILLIAQRLTATEVTDKSAILGCPHHGLQREFHNWNSCQTFLAHNPSGEPPASETGSKPPQPISVSCS